MKTLAPLIAIVLACGCAQSEVPDDSTFTTADSVAADVPSDTGRADSGTTDGTTAEDTGATADTGATDSGAPATDSEFPDFGGAPMDSGFAFPDGGAGICAKDGDCMAPLNCCELTKMRCGFKFGTTCMTF